MQEAPCTHDANEEVIDAVHAGRACITMSVPLGDSRGAMLVEFVVVLPLLILLCFGIVEFGVAFNASSTVGQSSRAGGRTAAISSLDPQMEFKAAEAAATSLNISPSSIAGQPTICVGMYDPSSGPCGKFSETVSLVHPGTPGSPVWQVQVGANPPGIYPANDNWALADRHYGCPVGGLPGTFDRVVVFVSIEHKLIVPGLFGVFFGNDQAPTLSSKSVFELEPVPTGSCS